MESRRLIVIAACAAATSLAGPAVAQAGAPRWYVQETGSAVPLNEQGGLVELESPEAIESLGAIKVFGRRSIPSECLMKDRETVSNPEEGSQPGTGGLSELEALCEKGSGTGNYAEPYPCAFGEPFELKAVELDWSSTLEAEESTKGRKTLRYYEHFANAAIEVYCMVSKEQDLYTGSLRPEAEIGRLNFDGEESGELTDAGGNSLSLKGTDFITTTKYKSIRVRADYEEKVAVTGLKPSAGPATGGTTLTVEGSGFALGDETTFEFGKLPGTSVNCILATQCTVTSPAEQPGTVHVVATVGGQKSKKNDRGDKFTYEASP
jgi:IPT/TIG domain